MSFLSRSLLVSSWLRLTLSFAISADVIIFLSAKFPNPKLTLASAAVVAPVAPFARATVPETLLAFPLRVAVIVPAGLER